MEHLKAWEVVDKGLKSVMAGNDSLSDDELKVKSKRLKHLAAFVETLRQRVNERIKGEKVGDIEPLFAEFLRARNEIDKTKN